MKSSQQFLPTPPSFSTLHVEDLPSRPLSHGLPNSSVTSYDPQFAHFPVQPYSGTAAPHLHSPNFSGISGVPQGPHLRPSQFPDPSVNQAGSDQDPIFNAYPPLFYGLWSQGPSGKPQALHFEDEESPSSRELHHSVATSIHDNAEPQSKYNCKG